MAVSRTLQNFVWIGVIVLATQALSACGGGKSSTKTNRSGRGTPVVEPPRPSLIQGGLLWDNHWAVTGRRLPVDADTGEVIDNPVWALREVDPLTGERNTASGWVTWQCTTCHGWDYRGADGNYGPGSGRYTGFPGIYDRIDGLTRDYVRQYLRNGIPDPADPTQRLHNFGTGPPGLSDDQIESLILFLFDRQSGLIDTSQYLFEQQFRGTVRDRDRRAVNGATVYESSPTAEAPACGSESCHGPTGTNIDFIDGDPASTPNAFLGTVAADDPWRALHKIRFGQPGLPEMTPVLGWNDIETAVDILAYLQSLPQ